MIQSFTGLISSMINGATASVRTPSLEPTEENYRFPVVVKPQTRAFLSAQTEVFGASMAGFAGALLDQLALEHMQKTKFASDQSRVVFRFHSLLDAHGLSLPEAAEVFKDFGIKASDLTDSSLLINKLTPKVLTWTNEHFYVRYEWLTGATDYSLLVSKPTWYKNVVNTCFDLSICTRKNIDTRFYVVKKEGIDFASDQSKDDSEIWVQDATQFFVIICVDRPAGANKIYTTHEVLDSERWSHYRSREHIKIIINFASRLAAHSSNKFHVYGREAAGKEFDSFFMGKTLPVDFLIKTSSTWNPESFASLTFENDQDKPEWLAITKAKEYENDFAELERILAY